MNDSNELPVYNWDEAGKGNANLRLIPEMLAPDGIKLAKFTRAKGAYHADLEECEIKYDTDYVIYRIGIICKFIIPTLSEQEFLDLCIAAYARQLLEVGNETD